MINNCNNEEERGEQEHHVQEEQELLTLVQHIPAASSKYSNYSKSLNSLSPTIILCSIDVRNKGRRKMIKFP